MTLRAWDDYPVHLSSDVLVQGAPPHPRWSERFYFNAQRPDGELVAIVGGGIYPAAGVAECYLCRLDGDRQSNLRAAQPLAGSGGPFSFRLEEPMRRWVVRVVGEFAATFEGTRDPFLFPAHDIPADEEGGDHDAFRHFVASGRMTVDGVTLLSARDRTWGVRSRRPRLHNWYVLHLDGCYLTLIHQERADGSVLYSAAALCHDDGRQEALDVLSHALRFDPEDRQISAGELQLSAGERTISLEFERVGAAIRLAGAGYDARQGARDAEPAVQRDDYDLADPDVAARTGRGTMDAGVRARLTDGERVAEGVGVVETAVARDHATYGGALCSTR